MGRGFGRGAKSVGIVTHAQVKRAKKLPKGIRGSRKKKRQMFHRQHDEQQQLEQSMGVGSEATAGGAAPKPKKVVAEAPQRTLAQEIAGVQFQQVVHGKRQRGFKELRRQLMASVKEVRRRHAAKAKARAEKERDLRAAQAKIEAAKEARRKLSGNVRRNLKESHSD